MRSICVVAFALAIGATVASAQESAIRPGGAGPEVETVGSGERRIAPDRAAVMLLVETRAPSAAAAATQNASAVAGVRAALRRSGVDTAVATASYHVGPEFGPPRPVDARDEPRLVGYIARTVLRVRVTRLEQLGPAIDAALAAGGTGVEGIGFESSAADSARRGALADAAAAARRDADVLARALGGTLGPLLSTSTLGSMDPRRYNLMGRDGFGVAGNVAMTQITPTEIVITAAVVGRWRFVPSQ